MNEQEPIKPEVMTCPKGEGVKITCYPTSINAVKGRIVLSDQELTSVEELLIYTDGTPSDEQKRRFVAQVCNLRCSGGCRKSLPLDQDEQPDIGGGISAFTFKALQLIRKLS